MFIRMMLFIIITAIAVISLIFDIVRNQTLFFYSIIVLIYYVYPFMRFIFIKLHCYLMIKNICDENEYNIKAKLIDFIFPSKKNTAPDMAIKIDDTIYAIRILGYFRRPMKYIFFSKNSYVVQKMTYLFFRGLSSSGILAVADLSGNMHNKYILDMDLDVVRNYFDEDLKIKQIMLFCPKFTVCEKFADFKYEKLYDKNDVYNYTIYNIDSFIAHICPK